MAFFRSGLQLTKLIDARAYAYLLENMDPRARWLYEDLPLSIQPWIEEIKKGTLGRPRATIGLPLDDYKRIIETFLKLVEPRNNCKPTLYLEL